ncbi:D,D-heptose 1,7-bisphosphate phosphatase [Luteitalea sp. TBR-22]|uniref:D-glycero-alpha-D-manno-heptose-1,7-bisphosphate 7-phosphatase n=1 Tax=Luteitalea sp. TBR-22 TaxID=2802971 RepID=UPI001AFAF9CF|nr:HAD family hydrolase [Luteitalea sp. TBR-22]BCS34759.1 D,D-heptose 1,7-bisphosphate phosphatase [Luteitalea sp. TBR-22]
MSSLDPAVFLDRDGTLIEEAGYLDSLDRLALFPSTVDALRVLARAGFRLVVVTNQSGIALGLFDEDFVKRTHEALHARLDAGGARIDGWYYCPHHPAGQVPALTTACDCRKPGPALPRQAASDLGLDLSRSWMVGDRWGDVQLAASAGMAGGLLVRTGYGRSAEARPAAGASAAHVADDLMDAAGWILRQPR